MVNCAPTVYNELILSSYVTTSIYNTFQTYDSEAFMDLRHHYKVMSFMQSFAIRFIRASAGSDQ